MHAKQTWGYWRGSPLLLAHVLRTMASAVEDETGAAARSAVDMEIDGDYERFASASDFLAQVTEQGLRHFSRVVVRAWNEHGRCDLMLTWLEVSWRTFPRRGAAVDLAIEGPTDAAAERMFEVVQPAVRRGARSMIDRARELAARAVLTATFVAGTYSAGYLLKLHLSDSTLRYLGVLVATPIALICTAWLFPALEIVPSRDTRRLRVLRIAGPIFVSVILAGVTKRLWN